MEAGASFLTSGTREAFNRLWLAFTEAPIFKYFNSEYHIWIEIDAWDYTINSVLSQLAFGTRPDGVVTKTDLSQWHSVTFFLKKMISAETWYKTHDGKLLAIIKAFKTWRHYLKNCKHKVFVFTDHKNLYCFIDTKSLSFRQVR